MSSRRDFIQNASIITLASGLGLNQDPSKPLFIHQVYFWLKNPESKSDYEHVIAGLKKLVKIKTIRNYHIGKPAGTSRDVIDASFSISLLTIFDSREDQDSYQVDPIHLEFIAACKDYWKRVLVYDSINV